MKILIRTDLGTQRIIETDDIAFADAASSRATLLELKSKPGFDFKVGVGIEDFLKVIKGEAVFSDLYIDQGYQKTLENSSDELEKLEFNEETSESKERLAEFKKELKPLKSLKPATFSKKSQVVEKEIINKSEKEVDSASDVW